MPVNRLGDICDKIIVSDSDFLTAVDGRHKRRSRLGAGRCPTALKNSNGSNSNKEKIQGHTVNFLPIRRPQRLAERVHNILTAIFTLKLKSMTCWNDCSVQEGYSKQTLMMLINGVNEVLTGRVSFYRQCSTGIMANVSGDNYIYYTLSYGILAGVWEARQLERRVKALALFWDRDVHVWICVCTRAWMCSASPPPAKGLDITAILVRQQHQTVAEQHTCINRQMGDILL